ncbi:hypothetical protein [Mangrovihabitans endophyticus]|nr:hypothetical protein [Mangrovihabitans endophyticus]
MILFGQEHLRQAMAAGASGFVVKDTPARAAWRAGGTGGLWVLPGAGRRR